MPESATSSSRNGAVKYVDAVILGFNDALVELTGALAGFTVSLPDNRMIFLAGLTTGVAATLSMASAEYLAKKSKHSAATSRKAACATALAYLGTTALLLAPFRALPTPAGALALSVGVAVVLILLFSRVVSRIRGGDFRREFLETLAISTGVAFLCFAVSWGANCLWGVSA